MSNDQAPLGHSPTFDRLVDRRSNNPLRSDPEPYTPSSPSAARLGPRGGALVGVSSRNALSPGSLPYQTSGSPRINSYPHPSPQGTPRLPSHRQHPAQSIDQRSAHRPKMPFNNTWSFAGFDESGQQPLTPDTNSPPNRFNSSPAGSGASMTRPQSPSSETGLGIGSKPAGKRRRELEMDAAIESRSKRPTPDPTIPPNALPMSRESSDGFTSALQQILGRDPEADMQSFRQAQREAEEEVARERLRREQQEKADEEFARRLHEEINGSSTPETSSRPYLDQAPSTQAVLGSNGRVRRPSPPAPLLPMMAKPPTYPQTPASPFETSKHKSSGQYSQRADPSFMRVASPDSDDDIEVLGTKPVSHQTAHSSRKLPWPSHSDASRMPDHIDLTTSAEPTNTFREAQYNHHGGLSGYNTLPNAAASNMPRLPSIQSLGRFHGGTGTPVYSSPASQLTNPTGMMDNTMEQLMLLGNRRMHGSSADPYSLLDDEIESYPSAPAGFGGSFNNSRFGSSIMGSSLMGAVDMGDRLGYLRSLTGAGVGQDFEWTSRDEGNVWGYNDADNSEALKDLLNNIRPDEEENLGSDDRNGTPEGMADTANLYKYQQKGLGWLTKMEEGSNKGSILADDMGLGKTIQAIALMVSRRSTDDKCKTNLIIAPVALVRQWESEIINKVRVSHQLNTFVYHGSAAEKKNATFKDLAKYDVVITTYGSLQSDHKKLQAMEKVMRANENYRPKHTDTPVLVGKNCRWYRVILDEAQNIKNKSAKTSQASYCLNSKYRLCMTGTPMMNSVTELYSLIHFLRIQPYCQWEKFNLDFARPLKRAHQLETQRAMQKMQALCKAIMLRRTKKSTMDGKPLIVLPERVVEKTHVAFDEDQSAFYQALETQSQLQFNKYLRAGTVGRNYSNVLTLLLRLRQAACHPHLIKDFAISVDANPEDLLRVAKELPEDAVTRLINGEFQDCPVCMDVSTNYTIFHPCAHHTCGECFCKLVEGASSQADANDGSGKNFPCCTCRAPIDAKKVTDWDHFKRVHQPHLAATETMDIQEDSESDSDEESDTEDDDADDDDSGMEDFIVKDDDEEALQQEDDDDDDDDDDDLDETKPARSVKKKPLVTKVKKEFRDGDDLDDDFNEQDPGNANGSNPSERSSGNKLKKKKRASKSKGKGKGKRDKKSNRKTMAELKKASMGNKRARRAYMKRLAKDYVPSAKTAKCVELLEEIHEAPENEKTIVFSQFTSLLDLVEIPINQKQWNYTRFDGSLSATDRNNAVQLFTKDPRYRIMLVSLKAGNAGLNLTAASRVIILDPFWNPYIEEQAIDRAHRIGQRNRVLIHRVLIENTVEDRIMALQEKKRALIEGALDEEASQNIGRLGTQELAFLFGVRS